MFVKFSIFTFVFLLYANPAFGKNDEDDEIPIAAFGEGLKMVAKVGQNLKDLLTNPPVINSKWESRRLEFTLDDNRYLFKEYAPGAFSQLRSVFGVEHQDYFVRIY